MGIEGTTLLRLHIREDGAVDEVIVGRSAGHVVLDQAAVEAVQRWRFEPARHEGRPVAVWVSLPIRFRLE
jgi:protein TonB